MIEIKNIFKKYRNKNVVEDVSFNIEKGKITSFIGPNGAGKTTVFNCITQFYKPNNGKVIFKAINNEEVNLVEKETHNIIKLGLVRTFQNVELIKDLSLLENLLIGAHISYKTGLYANAFRTKKARKEEEENIKKAEGILKFLVIENKRNELAGGQPYGILKKIELGRTLMSNPKLIILDEPAAGLNDTETLELAKLIKNIRDEYKCNILLVEHDMRLVMDICDRICAISFGKKLAEGTPKEIQSNKEVQEAYLGREE